MHMDREIERESGLTALPRARGSFRLSSKRSARRTLPDRFRTSGCLKALFPRHPEHCEAILINTSGGLTGGDRLEQVAEAGAGSHLTLTTQAAERAYRSTTGFADVTTDLTVRDGATLHWLPQELILFNGAALTRRLKVELEASARLLLVEPVIFGRPAMGEIVTNASLIDRIEINRAGTPLYRDAVRLTGHLADTLSRPAIGDGAGAMATLVYVAPDAEAHLDPVRGALPMTAGASLVAADTLVLRMLAEDAFLLRRDLLPVLDRLTGDRLPTSWRL